MGPGKRLLRSATSIVLLLAAVAPQALSGAAPAMAATAYGSGSPTQNGIQARWLSESGEGGASGITYTPTSDAAAKTELGNVPIGALDPSQDPTANPTLDGYVGTEEQPSSQELAWADESAGSGAQHEVTVPVAQGAETIDLDVPPGITLNSAQNIDLSNLLAVRIFSGAVPASADYSKNTWGALLENAKLSKVTGAPSAGQFEDSGIEGGATPIDLELPFESSPLTLNLKQYLVYVASQVSESAPLSDVGEWPDIYVDALDRGYHEWPEPASIGGWSGSDSAEAEAVAAKAGYVGFGTLTAALGVGFTTAPGSSGSHTLLAFLQDNGTGNFPRYADPEITSGAYAGGANLYSGTAVNISGNYSPGTQTGASNWLIPTKLGVFNAIGSWNRSATYTIDPSQYTHAWDVDIYGDTGSTADYYPLGFLLWDLSWSKASFGTGRLTSPLYPIATGSNSVEEAVASYFAYVTSSAGQAATVAANLAPLPAGAIQTEARKAAAAL